MEIFISNQFHRAGSDAGSFFLEKILGKYIFPRMKNMPPEEREKARKDLLEYCKLDTYAMVKILRELERVAE